MFQNGLKNGLKIVHRCLNWLNGSKMVKIASLLVKSGVKKCIQKGATQDQKMLQKQFKTDPKMGFSKKLD